MQALKALVIGMGILIVAGLGLMVYGFSTRLAALDDDTQPTSAAVTEQPSLPIAIGHSQRPLQTFGDLVLPIGDDETVAHTALEGDRLTVTTKTSDGQTKLHLFALPEGRKLGSILLQPTK